MNNPVFRFRALLGELRRRHVVQVAIVYCAAAFALLQGMDIVLPVLGVPEWVFRLVVITAVLGFPVALVLAWVYDLTPQGIVKVEGSGDGVEDPGHPRVGRAAGAGLLLLSITMVVGVVWLSFRWAVSGAEALAPLDPRAVAVLPFRGSEPE